MKIGVSLGDFYYWNKKFDLNAKLNYVRLLKDLKIEAVELHFSNKEIMNKSYREFRGKLGKWIVTVHLQSKSANKNFYGNLKEMTEILNVKYFIIHADQYAKIKNLVKGINILVENCDQEKKRFQDLKEVEMLGKDVCLDINHFEENFPGKLKNKIKDIRNKIKEIHISALNNSLYDYQHKSKSRHYLIYGSDYKLQKCLPKKAIWIIEGVIPKNRINLLEKEIKLLRSS